jgi:uncharacterized protein YukE
MDGRQPDLRSALASFQSAARELLEAWERVGEHYGDEIANYPSNWRDFAEELTQIGEMRVR